MRIEDLKQEDLKRILNAGIAARVFDKSDEDFGTDAFADDGYIGLVFTRDTIADFDAHQLVEPITGHAAFELNEKAVLVDFGDFRVCASYA